jgi:solute carrier family 25 phosphate transporter 23/24/25/41
MKAVDRDGNGHISYNGQLSQLWLRSIGDSSLTPGRPEFRSFVVETEKELLHLFKSIDHNNDGKISKPELRAALSRAGMAVPNSSLDTFFTEVDTNNDVTISFEEWRYVYQ